MQPFVAVSMLSKCDKFKEIVQAVNKTAFTEYASPLLLYDGARKSKMTKNLIEG